MLNHIVLMKFKPDIAAQDIDRLERMLDDLPNRIVEIQTYEFGRDTLGSARSFDFALVSGFANLPTLQRYQQHPDHLKVKALLDEICEQIVCVDFDSQPPPIIEHDPVDDLFK